MADVDLKQSEQQELLDEVRENYKLGCEAWQDIWDDGREDMRYIAGDAWDPDERKEREANNRPCLNFDETNQYVNQLINAEREKKRGIKVIPKGGGATEKTAEYRQGRIREIEERSKAQAAYITMFEAAAQRGYGYCAVSTRPRYQARADWEKLGARAFEQEIYIRRIPNPDTVVLDPNYKLADASDIDWGFITDVISRKAFQRLYSGAEIQSFSSEHETAAPQWLQGTNVQVAEYWKVKHKPRTALLMADGQTVRFLDQFKTGKLIRENRDLFLRIPEHGNVPLALAQQVDDPQVCQYVTNGVEILRYTEWTGKIIPIVVCFGGERYIPEEGGSGAKRQLVSLIRLARDPQMLLNYYRSSEAEIVGQVPKSPWVGYKEFFEGHTDEWDHANSVPRPYLVGNMLVDGNGEPIPLPQRQVWEPPVQAMEIGAEASRQAIRAAMGGAPLPTPAQRQNEKSGVALDKIDSAQQRGWFHFPDNFDRALVKAGEIINDILDDIEDTRREVGLVKPDESYEVTTLEVDAQGPVNGRGEHDVTLATGASFASQQEEAEDFVNLLVSNLEGLPLAPESKARLLAQLVKLKRLGPTGDEIIKLLTPMDLMGRDGKPLPPEVQAALAAEKQKLAKLNAYAKDLEQQMAELQKKLDAKVIDNEYKAELSAMEQRTKILIAEIQTRFQKEQTRMQMELEQWKALHGAQLERETTAAGQAHEREMTEGQRAHEAAQAERAAQAAREMPAE